MNVAAPAMEALVDVRAARRFADGVQIQLAQSALQAVQRGEALVLKGLSDCLGHILLDRGDLQVGFAGGRLDGSGRDGRAGAGGFGLGRAEAAAGCVVGCAAAGLLLGRLGGGGRRALDGGSSPGSRLRTRAGGGAVRARLIRFAASLGAGVELRPTM
jgi:hypothetical protein